MKALQSFDALLDKQIGLEFDPKPRVASEGERMDLHAIGWNDYGPALGRRIPSVLPRSASYAERLAEWHANRLDGVPDELC